jgi:predicted DNA-binding transcriptional regulator YafY
MRRSDRLFEIIQIVRDGRLHLARDIAQRLEVSVRTIYRDIDTLIASGIPLCGERGVGYVLREPVSLPPLNLSVIEMEALTFGMTLAVNAADHEIRAASQSVLAKINQVVVSKVKMAQFNRLFVSPRKHSEELLHHLGVIRSAIHKRQKLSIHYVSLNGEVSQRTVRPLQLEYWGQVWTSSCWCELREEFRVFRVDQISHCRVSPETFLCEPGKRIEDFMEQIDYDGPCLN